MEDKPLVSIICPSYGHERFVARAVESFIAQSYSRIEIIVVDDHSPDRSNDVIRGLRDPRLRLLSTDFNMGVPCAMNKGVRESSGSIICFCASDDMMGEEHVASVVEAFAGSDAGAVYARLEYVDGDGKPFGLAPATGKDRYELLRELLLDGNGSLYAPGSAFRREVFDRAGLFNPSLVVTHDYDFNVRALLRYDLRVLGEPTMRYRRLPGDSNLSGGARWVPFCYKVESEAIFENYLAIDSIELFEKIFPDARAKPRSVEDIGYCLAVVAIESDRSELSEWGFRKLAAIARDEKGWRRLHDERGLDFKGLRRIFDAKVARDEARAKERKDLFKKAARKLGRLLRLPRIPGTGRQA